MTSSGTRIDRRNLFIPIVHVRGTHYECGLSVVIYGFQVIIIQFVSSRKYITLRPTLRPSCITFSHKICGTLPYNIFLTILKDQLEHPTISTVINLYRLRLFAPLILYIFRDILMDTLTST